MSGCNNEPNKIIKYKAGHSATTSKGNTITSTVDAYRLTIITSQNQPLVNKNIKKVGVFVDPEIEYLNFIIKKYSLDLVQLHGNEKPDFISQIRDVKIIKAFSIDKNFNFNSTENYMKCDYFLFDTKGKLPGGNGISFDWKILTSYKFNKPYFLSGGIGLHNIEQLKDFFSSTISKYCFAVDINSHFEIEYAKKDYELIKNFKNEL